MGLDATFAPMGFTDDNDEITGYDVDLAKEVASRMGVELKLQSIDYNAKVLELDTEKIDMVWNGFTITEERAEKVLFSEPYMNNRQIVLTQDYTIALGEMLRNAREVVARDLRPEPFFLALLSIS